MTPCSSRLKVAVHASVDPPYSGQSFGCQFVRGAPVCQPLADHLEVGVFFLSGAEVLGRLHLKPGHHELRLRRGLGPNGVQGGDMGG